MEEIPVTEARAQFSELINRVGFGKERIVLTRHGKPLVALVPAHELTSAEDDRAEETLVLDLSSTTSTPNRPEYVIAARSDDTTTA